MFRTTKLAVSSISSILFAVGCIEANGQEPSFEPEEDAPRVADAICGDDTVANARAPSGNRVLFCIVDGVEVVAEGGTAEPLPDDKGCALHTFLALTDAATPVPARLVDSCLARGGDVSSLSRVITDDAVFMTSSKEDVLFYDAAIAGAYCGADGATAFSNDRCSNQCYDAFGADICAAWCKPQLVASSVNAISSVLGEQGNSARQTLASCNGATRFRGLRDRGAADPSYRTLYDIDVLTGQAWYIRMDYTTNGEDAWFQFRGDPLVGTAVHRHAGAFYDWK